MTRKNVAKPNINQLEFVPEDLAPPLQPLSAQMVPPSVQIQCVALLAELLAKVVIADQGGQNE